MFLRRGKRQKISQIYGYIYTRCVCSNKGHKCTHESAKRAGCVIVSLTYLVDGWLILDSRENYQYLGTCI